LKYVEDTFEDNKLLRPVFKAISTLKRYKDKILSRWGNDYSNARLEGLNGLFQAARARAKGYRNVNTFITMIYLLAAPIGVCPANISCKMRLNLVKYYTISI
jgi:transposase